MAKTKAAAKTTTSTTKASTGKRAKVTTIMEAPQGQFFFLSDGRSLKTLKELADALETMADHVYNHHVTHDRNDFANWIEGVFKEARLGKNVRDAPSRHHAQIILYRYILEQA